MAYQGVGATAAAGMQGGWDALAGMIADRRKQELVAQAEYDKQQQAALERDQFAEDQRQFGINAARQDQQTQALTGLRQAQADQLEYTRTKDTDELTRKATSRAEAIKQISESGLDDNTKRVWIASIDAGVTPPADLFKKPEDLGVFAQKADITAAAAERHRRPEQDPAGSYFSMPNTLAPGGNVMVDRHTGKSYISGANGMEEFHPDPNNPGVQGAPAADAIKKAAEVDQNLAQLQAVLDTGEKYKWSHTGPAAGAESWLSGTGLVPDPTGDAVKTAVGFARGILGHSLYGGALTEGETRQLNTFMASPSLVGAANKARIQMMMDILRREKTSRLAGPFVKNPGDPGYVTAPAKPMTADDFTVTEVPGAGVGGPRTATMSPTSAAAEAYGVPPGMNIPGLDSLGSTPPPPTGPRSLRGKIKPKNAPTAPVPSNDYSITEVQ